MGSNTNRMNRREVCWAALAVTDVRDLGPPVRFLVDFRIYSHSVVAKSASGIRRGGDGFLSSVSDSDRCFPLKC
jgi:hypothetical protein